MVAFETKKIHCLDRFRGNGPYGKIPTKEEPIRTLGFTLPYNNAGIILILLQHNAVISENCEKCMQILPATRSRMYKVDKSGNILGS